MSFLASKPLTATALSLVLAACASEPKIDASRLSSRSSVEINVSISDSGAARSGAFTKGEGGAGGAAGGAAAGLGMWGALGEVGLAALILAPGVVVGTAVVGAGIGAASGTAAGTNYTREDIDRAIQTVESAFAPQSFDKEFEAAVASKLQSKLQAGNGPCITTSSERQKCQRTGSSSVVKMNVSSRISASASQSGRGDLDFFTQSTLWTEPRGVISPDCVTLLYRYPAGNLFDLAANNGAPVQASYRRMLASMSEGLVDQMLGRPTSQASGKVTKSGKGRWAKESCDYTTRLLSSTR